MQVTIREFREEDILDKVRWINDPGNNRYLHYDLPLTEEGTGQWFSRVRNRRDRLDCVITADGVPCGVIGLLHIDPDCQDAEFYITVGEKSMKRKGIAYHASQRLLGYAFCSLHLTSVYLYTEPGNLPAKKLFRKLGFTEAPNLCDGIYPGGKPACRFAIRLPMENGSAEEPWKPL